MIGNNRATGLQAGPTTVRIMNDLDFQNEGPVDRAVRVIAGLALLTLCFVGPQTVWGLLGLFPLVTGISGDCPFYRALGVSTRTRSVS
jgi:hypothetical protein